MLRRLELGLLFVTPQLQLVEPVLYPQPLNTKQSVQLSKRKKSSLLRELEQRQFNENKGGSTGVKLLTAYREKTIYVCCALYEAGKSGAKDTI